MFAVRIVSTEHHMAAPVRGLDVCHSEFRQSAVSRVPVIRVFGATPAGQKTCLHLHGVFPYLYVPYDGTEPESRYLRQFAASVDKAINVALNRSNSNQQHVYKISIVAALPFYGYYEVEKPFLKIYLYNPLMVKKLADLLIGGAIMNKIYQPFETHIPYDLQMLIDYNLHGMNMINLAAVKFRRPKSQDGQERGNNMNSGSTGSLTPSLKLLQESSQFSSSPCLRRWNCDSIPSEQYIDLDCTSTCELEVDAVAADVLNRLEVTDNIGGNPGLAALWEDERQRRKEMGLDDDLEPPSSPSRGKIPWTDAEAALQDRFSEILEELKPYMQADDNDVSSSFPSTQASLVEDHLSQSLISSQLSHNPSWASQDTVMLSDEDDEAVVCETSILRVVASSQSFRGSPPADVDLDSTQDQHLVDVLADLADDNDSLPLNTQKSATFRERRIDLLEEQDSILSQVSSSLKVKSTNGSSDDDTDERETLEMTQSYKPDDFDLEGMDASWSSSQWVDVGRADEEALPQYDGTGDEKFATTSQRSLPHKKRTFPVHLSDDETTTPVIKNVALNKQTKPLNTPNVDRNSKPIVDLSPTGRSPRASKSKCMAFLKDVTGAVRPYNAQPKKQEDNKEKEKPVVKGGKKEKPVVKGGKKEKPVVKVVENSKSVNKGNEKSPKVKEVVKMNETPTARKRGRPKKVEKNPVELQVNVESKESDVSTEKVSPGNPRTIFNKERLKIIKERKALSSKSEQAEKTASAESVDKISSKAKLSAESAKNEAGNCKKGSDAKDSFRTIKLKRRVVDNKSEKQEMSTGVHEEQQEGKQEDVPAGKASQVMEDILAEMDEDGNFTNLKPKENEEHVPSKDFFDPSKSKPASEDRYETHKEESEEELPRPKVTGKTYKRNIKPEVEKKLTRLKAKQDRKEIEELMPAPKHPAPNSPRRGGNSPRLLEEASKNVHDLSDCSNKPSLKESESDSDRPVNYELAKRRGSDSEGSEIDEIQAAQFRKFKVGQHKRTYMKTFRPSDTYEQSDNAKSAEIFVKESPKMSVLSTEDISDDEFKPVVKKRGRPKKAKPALSKKVGNTKRTKQGNTTSNKIVSAKNTETVPYDNNDDLVKTMPESDVNINKPKEKTVEEHKDDPNKEPSNYVESKDGLSKVSSEKQTEEKKCDIEENHAPSDPNTSQSQNEVISLPGNRPDVGKPEDITYDKKSADVRSMTDDPQITMISVQPQEGTEKLCGIKEDLLKKEESTDDSEDEEEEMMSSDPGGNSSVAGGNSTGGSGRLSSSDPQKRLYNRKRNFVGVKVPNPKKKLDMRNAKFCGFECTRIVKEDDEEEEEEPEPQAFAVRAVPVSYKQAQSHRRQAIRKTKQKLVQSGVCRINESFSTSEDESSGTLSSSSKKSGWSRPIAQYTSPSKKIPVSRGKQLPKVKKPSAPARSAFSILESCQNQDVNEPSDEQSQVSENVVGEQMDEEQAYQQLVEHESGTYAIVGDSLYLVQAEGEGNTLQYVGDAVDQSAAVQYVLMEQTDLDMMPPPQPPDGTIQQVCETPEVQRHGDDSDMPHLPHEMEVEPVLETSKSDLLLEDDAHDADHFLGEAPVLDEALVAAAPVEGATTTITRLAPRLQAFVHKTRTGARVLLPSSHKAPVRPSMSASGARVLLPAADRPVLIRPPVDTTDESTSSDSRSPSPDRRKKKLSLEQRNDRRKQRKAREVASKQEAHDAAKKQASLNEEQHKRRKSSSSEKISNEIALIKKQSQSSERKALIECQQSVVDLEKTNKLKKNKGRPKSEEIPQSKKIAESVKSKTKRISALEKDSSMIPFDHEDDMWKTPDKLKAKNSCARSPKSHGSPPYKGVRPPYYNPSSLFWFSCHRKVNYVNGKVSDNPAYVAKVQVYQKDCEEHDMHPIGNERLVMMKENDEDIRELKEQVKREVAHMKREKQAFMVAMEKEENEHEQCVSMAPEQPVSSSKKDNYVKSSASDDEADVSHEDVFPDLSPVGEKKALGSSRYENEIDQCVGDMPSKEDVNCDEKVIEKDLITAGIDTQKSDIIDEDLRDEELVDKKVNEDGDGNEKVIKELSNSGMSDFEKCMLSINHGVDIAKMDFHYSKPKSRKESSSKKSSYTSSSHGSKEGIKIKISRSRISSSETTVKEKKQDLDEEKSGERRSNEEKKINKSDDSSSHYTHTEEEKNLKESRYDESSISKEQKTSCISDKRTCSHDRKYHHRSRTSSEKERGYRSSTSEGHKSHDRKQHSSHDKRKHRTESHSHKESSSSGKDAHKHRHHDKKHRSHSHRRDSDRNRRNSEGKSKHSRSSEDSKREGHNRSDKDRKDSEKEISPKAQFSNENLNSGVEPRLSVDTNTEELKSDISINNNETILSSKVDEVNVPHSLESIKDSQSNLNETVQIQRMEEIQEDKTDCKLQNNDFESSADKAAPHLKLPSDKLTPEKDLEKNETLAQDAKNDTYEVAMETFSCCEEVEKDINVESELVSSEIRLQGETTESANDAHMKMDGGANEEIANTEDQNVNQKKTEIPDINKDDLLDKLAEESKSICETEADDSVFEVQTKVLEAELESLSKDSEPMSCESLKSPCSSDKGQNLIGKIEADSTSKPKPPLSLVAENLDFLQPKQVSKLREKTDRSRSSSKESDRCPGVGYQEVAARAIGDSRSSSRRSSGDQTAIDKGVTEVDFSVLEQWMDTEAATDPLGGDVAATVVHGSEVDRQLHTPPLVLQDNLKEATEQTTMFSESDCGMGSEDGHAKRPHKIQHKKYGLYRTESNRDGNRKDMEDKTDGSLKKKHKSKKSIGNSDSRGLKSKQFDDFDMERIDKTEEDKKGKRKVFEQSDHYRFRSKRVAVDYTPGAFTHVYEVERAKSLSPVDDDILNETVDTQVEMDTFTNSAAKLSTLAIEKLESIKKKELQVVVQKLSEEDIALLSTSPTKQLPKHPLDSCLNESVTLTKDSSTSAPSSPSKSISKKKLSNRLDSAFCKPSPSYHRKRTQNKKFKEKLSALHEATISTLKETHEESISEASSPALNADDSSLDSLIKESTAFDSPQEIDDEFRRDRIHGESSGSGSPYAVRTEVVKLGSLTPQKNPESPLSAPASPFESTCMPLEIHSPKIVPQDATDIIGSRIIGRKLDRPTIKAVNALYDTDRNVFNALTIPNRISLSPGNNNNQSSMPLGVEIDCHHESDVSPFCSPNSDDHRHLSQQTDGMNDVKNTKPREPHRFSFKRSELSIERMRGTTSPKSPSPTRSLSVPKSSSPPRSPSPPASPVAYAVAPQKSGLFGSQSPMFIPNMPLLDDEGPQSPDHIPTNIPVNVPAVIPDAAEFDNEAPASPTSGIGSSNVGPVRIPDDMPPASPSAPGSPDAMSDSDSESSAIVMPLDIQDDDDDGAKSLLSAPDSSENHPSVPHVSSVFPREIPSLTNAGEEYIEAPSSPSLDEDAQSYELVKAVPMEMPASPVADPPLSLKHIALTQNIPTEMPVSPVELNAPISPKPVSDTIGIPIEMPTSPVEYESPSSLKDFAQMQDIPTEMPASPVQRDVSISPKTVSDTIGIPIEMPTSPVECESPSTKDFVPMQDIPTEMPASPVELDASISPKPVSDTIGIPTEMPTSPVECESPSSLKDFGQMQDISTEMPASPVELDAPISLKPVSDTIGIPIEMPTSPVELGSPSSPKDFVQMRDIPTEMPASPVELDAPSSPKLVPQTIGISSEMPASPVELDSPKSPKEFVLTLDLPREIPASPEPDTPLSPNCLALIQAIPIEMPASPVELNAPISPKPVSDTIGIPIEMPTSPVELESASSPKDFAQMQDMPTEVPASPVELDAPSSPGPASHVIDIPTDIPASTEIPLSPDYLQSAQEDKSYPSQPVKKIALDIPSSPGMPHSPDSVSPIFSNKFAKSIPMDMPMSPDSCPSSLADDDPFDDVPVTKCIPTDIHDEAPNSPEQDAIRTESVNKMKSIPTDIPGSPEETPTSPKYDDYVAPSIPVDITKCPDAPKSPEAPLSPERHMQSSDFIKGIPTEIPDAPTDSNVDSNAHSIQTLPAKKNSPSGTPGNCISKTDLSHMKNGNSGGKRKRPFSTQMVERIPKKPGRIIIKRLKLSLSLEDKDSSQTVSNVANQQSNAVATPTSPTAVDTPASPTAMDTPASPIRMDTPASPNAEDVKEIKPPVNISIDQETETNETSQIHTRKIKIHRRNRIKIARPKTVIEESPCSPPPHDGPASPDVKGHRFDPVIPKIVPDCPTSQVEASNVDANVTKFKAATGDSFDKSKSTSSKSLLDSSSLKQKSGRFSERNYRKPYSSMSKRNRDGQYFSSNQKTGRSGSNLYEAGRTPPRRHLVLQDVVRSRLFEDSGAKCSHPQDAPEKPRELGGKILKVQSPLISSLPTYESSFSKSGILHWQSVILAKSMGGSSTFSQDTSTSILESLRRSQQIKILGDSSTIITPCLPPPTYNKVKSWGEERKKIQGLVNKHDKSKKVTNPKIADSDTQNDVVTGHVEKIESKSLIKKGTNIKNRSTFQGKKETVKRKNDLVVSIPSDQGDDQNDNEVSPTIPVIKMSRPAVETPKSILVTPKRRHSFSSDDVSQISHSNIQETPKRRVSFEHHETPKRRVSFEDSTDMTHGTYALSATMHPAARMGRRRVSFEGDVMMDGKNPCDSSRRTLISSQQLSSESEQICSTPSSKRADKMKLDAPQVTPIRRKEEKVGQMNLKEEFEEQSNDEDDDSIIPPTPEANRNTQRIGLGSQKVDHSQQSTVSKDDDSLRQLLLSSQVKHYLTPSNTCGNVSQIDGPTPKNSFGFKISQNNMQDAKALHEFQYLTILSLELHIEVRANLRPDPEIDAICAIFYTIHNDIPPERGEREITGTIIVDPSSASLSLMKQSGTSPSEQQLLEKTGLPNLLVKYVDTENAMIETVVEMVRSHDPDIILGWEIEQLSWGYLLQRAAHLSINLKTLLSRVISEKNYNKTGPEEKDKDTDTGALYTSVIRIPGRIVLDLWRILRHEVTLNIYSFENVYYHVLHKRIPLFSHKTLYFWFKQKTHLDRWKTLEYFMLRCRGNIQIMESIDLVGQASEFARVFGIEFYNVLSRGSQYRVESMMLRIAKPMDFIPVSPSIHQRARMLAPECIPLTLEPESKFYTEPVVVVDFQSLYPSIMIAYNYCFSTVLGRLDNLEKSNDGPFPMGCTTLDVPPTLLEKLKDDINICPNGVVFVNSNVRKGILPRMLEDILKTRIMVKKSAKHYKDDKTMQRLLHARQLGLKLIANVTFGYTAANYSGRMPCVEVGDSIVRKARETLERAIHLIEATPKWGARVVYGDTDSMFIELPGRTKDEAFTIGQEIADAVTADNPKPIKLKFEKVYLPCILQTKKRYVGYMYETRDQKEPVFDAKGIETVRRDTCTAVSKVLERSIKILFNTSDVSQVRMYVQKQCTKLMEGKVSLQDMIFAKEYRGMGGYRPGACVPALEIARRRLLKDRRSEPRSGERVPYVIVYGIPGLPLIQLVKEPLEVLSDPTLRINSTYYITKQILPPLQRIMMLLGLDVFTWYNDLPRVVRSVPQEHFNMESKKETISQYFTSLNCPVCEVTTNHGMCNSCRNDPQEVAVILSSRIQTADRINQQLAHICTSCMGHPDSDFPCTSLDCPVMYRMNKALRDVSQIPYLHKLLDKYLPT